MLIFRTCALKHDSTDTDVHCSSSTSNTVCSKIVEKTLNNRKSLKSPINSDIKSNALETSTQEKLTKTNEKEGDNSTSTDNNVQQINVKKRPIDSMSSSLSDQSLSSVCGDTSEIESAMQDLTDYPQHSELVENNISINSLKKSKPIEASTSKSTPTKYVQRPATSSSLNSSMREDKENEGNLNHKVTTMPATLLGMTYRFQNTETKLLRKILSSHGLTEVSDEDMFNLLWTGVHIKPDILRNLVSYQRVNHFPR